MGGVFLLACVINSLLLWWAGWLVSWVVCGRRRRLNDPISTTNQTASPHTIQSLTGGPQSSPERFASPVDVIFTVIFQTTEDRDYYLNEDEVHLRFGREVAGPLVDGPEGVFVMDYEHVY